MLTPPDFTYERAWAATYAADAWLADWSLPSSATSASVTSNVVQHKSSSSASNTVIDVLTQQSASTFSACDIHTLCFLFDGQSFD
jgi:hypothetical protein